MQRLSYANGIKSQIPFYLDSFFDICVTNFVIDLPLELALFRCIWLHGIQTCIQSPFKQLKWNVLQKAPS